MQLLGWNAPLIAEAPFRQAEQHLLSYVLLDTYDPWATLLSDQQLTDAIGGYKGSFHYIGLLGTQRRTVMYWLS